MGYGITQKGYRLYDFEHKSFFINRDFIFTENVFSFQTSTQCVLHDLTTEHEEVKVLIHTHLNFDSAPALAIQSNPSLIEDEDATQPVPF